MTATRTTYRTFDQMTEDPRWEGWGYIGGRLHALEYYGEWVAGADAEVIRHAKAAGWSDEDLFRWANSKPGRWFADATNDPAYRAKHAATLLALPKVF